MTFAPTVPTAVNDSVFAFTARSIENPVSLLDASVQRSVTSRFAPAVAVRFVGAAGGAGADAVIVNDFVAVAPALSVTFSVAVNVPAVV